MVRFDPNAWAANTIDPWRRRIRAVIRWSRLPWDLAVMAIWWLLTLWGLRRPVRARRPAVPQSHRSSRWAFMERFEVPDYDRPERNYLTRWRVIQTPWAAIYLHRMDGPDPRATLHDHPWPFISIVLRGWYIERRTYAPDYRRWHIRHINIKRATDLHYIEHIRRQPTWTLMLVGRRRRDWGFLDDDGTWTRFDQHPHAAEFDQAMAERAAMRLRDSSWVDPTTGTL